MNIDNTINILPLSLSTIWKSRGVERLRLYYRFPFYIALISFGIGLIDCINLGYPAIYSHVWPDPFCTIIGFGSVFITYLSQFLLSIVAVKTYLKVEKIYNLDFGIYDWKLFFHAVNLSLLVTILPFASHGYGGQNTWCAVKQEHRIEAFILNGVSFVNMIIAVYCYFGLVIKLRARESEKRKSFDLNRIDEMEDQTTNMMVNYFLVSILQWVSVSVFSIGFIFEHAEVWTLVATAIAINIGGIGNVIVYALNEKSLKDQSSSNKLSHLNDVMISVHKQITSRTDRASVINTTYHYASPTWYTFGLA
ncbi:8331_t:CDS:2 [Ambispora gerdemannii]|uniref:8331_t:CDS:1 n=1 Tax=Ambispora gerdemannii TaxID=144530 RepID=A0A9N9FNC3_9GLOM|nr:8331_t:CDS:2 [Ambispora gerdemannii]